MALIWQAAGIPGVSDSAREESGALKSRWKYLGWGALLSGLTLFPLLVLCSWIFTYIAVRIDGRNVPIGFSIRMFVLFLLLSFASKEMQVVVYSQFPVLWALPFAGIVGVFFLVRRALEVCEQIKIYLETLIRRSEELVLKVNADEYLSFDAKYILRDEREEIACMFVFLAFDSNARKILVGNASTGDYAIKDFGWIQSWTHRWDEDRFSESEHQSSQNGYVGAAGGYHGSSSGTTVTRHFVNKTNHRIELQVKSLDYPVVDIGQREEEAAERWIPKLSLILNG